MLVLVNPNNRILSEYSAIEPPLWAGLLATHYRNSGRDVRIVDAEAYDLTPEETAQKVLAWKPDSVMIVVMGNNPSVSSTPKMKVTKQLVDLLKPEVASVSVTGLHPTALQRETEKELGVYVVPGKIFSGTPDVAWDLMPMDLYRAHVWHCLDGSERKPYASLATSYGCPFSCEFCNISVLYGGHKIEFCKPDNVIRDIDLLNQNYKVKNIKFWDELFTFNKGHVEQICDLLIERNYGLNIWAYARVDCVSPFILKKMKRAGINWLSYGFEAGDDDVLQSSHKRATKQKAVEAVRMTHDAGINILGNFIFGLPNDTQETMERTLAFAKSLDIEFVNCYDFHPYPGSELYKQNPQKWDNYDQYGQIKTFRDKAFLSYFTDVHYLNHIQKVFGEQSVKTISDMVKSGKPQSRGTYADTTIQK